MANGLDALDAKRERRGAVRSESIPPPKHQPRSTSVSVDVNAAEQPRERMPPTPPAKRPASAPAATDELIKTTMHLGPTEDAFLEEVRFAGRRGKPKVDASRSAVTRMAIARLAEQMSAEEIVAALRTSAPRSAGTGRKRLG